RDYEIKNLHERGLRIYEQVYYAELLTPERQKIAEKMFRALCERSDGQNDTRRPVQLRAVADLAGVAWQEAAKAADVFREAGRSFISPPPDQALTADSILDISHESLIRQWDKLRQWSKQEAESAYYYRRYAQSARLHKLEQTGYLRNPELEFALQWRLREQPAALWAQRYTPVSQPGEKDTPDQIFARTMAFIDASEQARQREEKAAAAEHRRKLRRTHLTAWLIFGLLAALLLMAWAYRERLHETQQQLAQQAQERTQESEKLRTHNLFDAYLAHASLLAKGGDFAAVRRVLGKSYALDEKIPAPRRHARNFLAGFSRIMGSAAEQVYQGAGAALLVVAASPDGLLLAAAGERGMLLLLEAKSGRLLQRLQGHNASAGNTGAVRAVVFHPQGVWLAGAGDDRRIILWSLPEGKQIKAWEAPAIVNALAITPDSAYLASGGDDNDISLWDVAVYARPDAAGETGGITEADMPRLVRTFKGETGPFAYQILVYQYGEIRGRDNAVQQLVYHRLPPPCARHQHDNTCE
ncbi:MAG: hypothetical protein GY862_23580, partial [Gammaproteobacteria bacterium]|nr:hypothetical protein [Gammaproteobacteria bacterium]